MPKTRVLVVDDAVVMRRLLSSVIEQEPDMEVAGVAAHGRLALAKIPHLNPDCVTLDVEMPEMDGLEAVVEIRKQWPNLPVIMVSGLTEKGASKTLDALARGATDYVTKPGSIANFDESVERLRQELIPKIRIHCRAVPEPAPPAERRAPAPSSRRADLRPVDAILIATSTGGPAALARVIPALPAQLSVPVLAVQHMPPVFTAMLAERLTAAGKIPVHEGAHGQLVEPGHMYIAPGGRHMEVRRSGDKVVIALTDAPPENSCRPAADPLFRSAGAVWGGNLVAAVLTGMGQDGLRGSKAIAELGAEIIAQDEASSVVWGMPGAVASAGLARQLFPIDEIASALVRSVARGPSTLAGVR